MFKLIGNAKEADHIAFDKRIEFATANGDEFSGIRYFNVQSVIFKRLYDLIPQEMHRDFYTSLLVINDNIPPHTDIVDTACFNCYIEPGGYSTLVYTNKANAMGVEFSDRSDGHLFDKNQLQLSGSFTAKEFEIYLLNNKCIHEVFIDGSYRPVRKVLQLATNKYSYAEVDGILSGMEKPHVL